MTDSAVLIVAKAPVPGLAKTRLATRYGPRGAAALAAAALLDTLRTARQVAHTEVIVAYTGDLGASYRADDLLAALRDVTLLPQRGDGFAQRLTNAHLDAAATGAVRVLQIGMDTPQVRVDDLEGGLSALEGGRSCVLGEACDGGWWAFGTVRAQGARALATVPMSRPDTGRLTRDALAGAGLTVHRLATMSDVDVPDDVDAVARACPDGSEFACTAEHLGTVVR
ncbi:DUF2064 domain-containing protein [Gordonia sp. LSe1-13]|uniref:DUF2064 domain-containing protein n=1 Tax=Gordonia sesuvii TaxID=3116777 RepID=A0ABU7MKF3_9ACTN|nr:DUF2064 domain-containing protein [Gordonia sp. LSe1-13]